MNVEALTPNDIRKKGIDALAKALGPLGMVRFLQQFELGAGNYTKERELWLSDMTVKYVVAEIKEKRAKK